MIEIGAGDMTSGVYDPQKKKMDVFAEIEKASGEAVKEATKAVYPVGAIYLSTVETSPATLFGFGTWERIQDTFLLAAGSSYAAGVTGGEATHKLTIQEMPSHSHDYQTSYSKAAEDKTTNGKFLAGDTNNRWIYEQRGSIYQTGGDAAHNNMPPYLAVYVWKRTA